MHRAIERRLLRCKPLSTASPFSQSWPESKKTRYEHDQLGEPSPDQQLKRPAAEGFMTLLTTFLTC